MASKVPDAPVDTEFVANFIATMIFTGWMSWFVVYIIGHIMRL